MLSPTRNALFPYWGQYSDAVRRDMARPCPAGRSGPAARSGPVVRPALDRPAGRSGPSGPAVRPALDRPAALIGRSVPALLVVLAVEVWLCCNRQEIT